MTTATQARAEFLKAAERSVSAADATLAARWGEAAGDTAQSSVLVAEADATAELTRQMVILDDVLVEDSVLLEGLFFDLEGQTVRVDYSAPGGGSFLGGDSSVDLLVTKARVDPGAGTTLVQGFIRL